MQRNEPQWSAAIFSAAVLAGVLVVSAGWTTGWLEIVLGALALAAFLFAAVAGIWFMVSARGDRPPPTIKVSLATGAHTTVLGSVLAEQMTARDTLKVRVIGDYNLDSEQDDQRLYDGRFGADGQGKIDLPINVTIPSKPRFKWVSVLAWIANKPDACFLLPSNPNFKNTPGCVVMRVPASF